MSGVTASKLDITLAEYRAGMSSYNSAKTILKDIHVNNKSAVNYNMEQLFDAVKSGNTQEILSILPEKLAIDAKSELDTLKTALNNPSLASFWRMKDLEEFKIAIASGVSTAFLFAGVAYLIIMAAAASYIARPPQGWMPARMKVDVQWQKKIDSRFDADDCKCSNQKSSLLWFVDHDVHQYLLRSWCDIRASPLAQESIGLTPSEAAAVVGMMAIFNVLGRIGWASFSDFRVAPIHIPYSL